MLGSDADGGIRRAPGDIPIGNILAQTVVLVKRSPLGVRVPQQLAEKIRLLRQQRGMTQVELAHILGIKHQGYISNLEAGRKLPSLDLLVQIADLFGVTTDYLLRDSLPTEPPLTTGEQGL